MTDPRDLDAYTSLEGVEECKLVHRHQAFGFQTSPPALLLPEGQRYWCHTQEAGDWAVGYIGHF